MELKIKKIEETERKSKNLTEISGYCMIKLIAKRIFTEYIESSDENIINYEFVDYDFDENNKRMSNKEYIKCANEYIKNLNLR